MGGAASGAEESLERAGGAASGTVAEASTPGAASAAGALSERDADDVGKAEVLGGTAAGAARSGAVEGFAAICRSGAGGGSRGALNWAGGNGAAPVEAASRTTPVAKPPAATSIKPATAQLFQRGV